MASANTAPSTLEQAPFGEFLGIGRNSMGLLVPQILLDFEQFLEQEEAFRQQGLFRLAGSGLKVNDILSEMDASHYQMGGDVYPWGIHEITSLVKVGDPRPGLGEKEEGLMGRRTWIEMVLVDARTTVRDSHQCTVTQVRRE